MRKNEVTVVEKKENKGLSKVKKAVAAACGAGYMAMNAMLLTVFAAQAGGTLAITQPLDNLKTPRIRRESDYAAFGSSLIRNHHYLWFLYDLQCVDEIEIKDSESYSLVLEHVRYIYEQNRHEFQKKIAEKNKRQAQRNQERIKREKEEFLAIQSKIIPGKYNVFHWPAKLDVYKLKRLYMSDAKGIQDMILVDEIGLTLYMRCKYGKEGIERMEQGIIRCHNCDEEILGLSDFRQCSCGYQYSYREYRRSYRRNNMPAGAVTMVFETFMNKWDRAKSYQGK